LRLHQLFNIYEHLGWNASPLCTSSFVLCSCSGLQYHCYSFGCKYVLYQRKERFIGLSIFGINNSRNSGYSLLSATWEVAVVSLEVWAREGKT